MTCIQEEERAKIVRNHNLPTIKRIPDKLWDEFKKILPREKPPKTVGRPVVSYRKVLDGILYVLRTAVSGRCCPRNMVQVLSVTGDFRSGINWIFSKKHGLDY